MIMKKKKQQKKENMLHVPVETLEEAEAIITKAVQTGKLSLPPYESKIPAATFAGCKTTLDRVKAGLEYMSNRPVTDEEFYELISESPRCLGDNFAQKKIRQWQSEVNSSNKDKALDAQEKLNKIGQALARKKKDPRIMFEIVAKRSNVYDQLKQYKISKMKQAANKRLTLKKLFGDNIINSIDKLPQSDSKLADLITALIMKTTSAIVEKCHKKQVEKLQSIPVFRNRR